MINADQLDSLLDRWEELRQLNQEPSAEELCRQTPELLDEFKKRVARLKMFESVFGDTVISGENAGVGKFCNGRYEIESLYDQGGLGALYLARDTELGRSVIVKGIRTDRAEQSLSRQQFETEAIVTAQLEHPGIVPVYGFGRDEHRRPYYVMRMIRGTTLRDVITQFHDEEPSGLASRSVASQRLLRHFLSVCQTIQFAHSRGIIHRDIKPANIMVGKFGEVLIVDWGLARQAAIADSADEHGETPIELDPPILTRQGSIKGSPMYMSPEQAAGRTDAVGIPSDVYGLGATFYEILTGQPPFTGESSEQILERVRSDNPQPPRQVKPLTPPALEAICLKALQRDPGNRYATARQLAEELERYLADEPVTAYPETLPEMLRRWSRRHRTLASTAAAATLVALVAMIVVSIVLSSSNRRLVAANNAATLARGQAETAEKSEREHAAELDRALYVNQINLADVAWKSGELPRLREVLTSTNRALRGLEWGFLDQQSRSPPVLPYYSLLPRRMRSMTYITPSPDGNWAMTEELDRSIGPQAVRGRHIVSTIDGAAKIGLGAGFLAFSPDGSAILRRQSVEGDAGRYRLELVTFATGIPVWKSEPLRDEGFGLFAAAYVTPDPVVDEDAIAMKPLIVVLSDPWATTPPGAPQHRMARLQFFDTESGQLVKTIEGDDVGNATQVTFSPDGRRFALTSSAPGPQAVPVLATQTGKRLLTLTSHTSRVNALAFSTDHSCIVTAGADGSVRIWSATTGNSQSVLWAHRGPVLAVAIDEAASRVASAGTDGGIRFWNVGDGRLERTVLVDDDEIYALAFSPDRSRLFAGGTDGVAYAIPADAPSSGSLTHIDDFVSRINWAPTNDRYAAVVSGAVSAVRVFSATGQQLFEAKLHRPENPSQSLYSEDFAFSPDGQSLAIGGDGFVQYVDAANGAIRWEVPRVEAPMAITPDGKQVIAVRNRRALIDVIDQERLFAQVQGEHTRTVVENALQGGQDPFRYPDGEKLLVSLLEREPGNRKLIETLKDQARGAFVALDIATGKITRVFDIPAAPTNRFAMHPTRSEIAIPDESTITILDLDSGKVASKFQGDWGSIWRLTFSPDGKRLVIVRIKDNTPVVIDASDGRQLLQLAGNVEPVQQAVYASDGRRIVTCAVDGTVHIWDAQTGVGLLAIAASKSPLYSVAVRGDGRQILAAGGDSSKPDAGELLTWEVSPTK